MRRTIRIIGNAALYLFFVFMTMAIGMSATYAQEKRAKKVQEVSFDGSDVDGEARKPDGAYLVQKKGVEFVPLYNVKSQFDQNIKDSVDYIK